MNRVDRRENRRAVENSLLSSARARLPLFHRSSRARRLPVFPSAREDHRERSRVHGASILSAPSIPHVRRRRRIGRLMDRDAKWRQSVSPFSRLYRRNLRRAYCSTVPGRQTARDTGDNAQWYTT